jgi:hypothetical protein
MTYHVVDSRELPVHPRTLQQFLVIPDKLRRLEFVVLYRLQLFLVHESHWVCQGQEIKQQGLDIQYQKPIQRTHAVVL